jgi:hypothetical protein
VLLCKEALLLFRWVELYEFHDKYTFVGVVAESPVEDVVARAMLEHAAIQALQQQQARAGPDEPAIAAQSTAEERVSQLRADAAARCVRGGVWELIGMRGIKRQRRPRTTAEGLQHPAREVWVLKRSESCQMIRRVSLLLGV